MIEIAVGSENPVKLEAARVAADAIWDEVRIYPVDVDPGVSEQPTSDRESIEGGKARAHKALQKQQGDFGFGLEGSTVETEGKMFLTGWAVVITPEEEVLVGGGGRLPLPERIASKIRRGYELGPLMDDLVGCEGVNEDIGAIGVFTGGLISRKDAYVEALLFALSKVIKPDLY